MARSRNAQGTRRRLPENFSRGEVYKKNFVGESERPPKKCSTKNPVISLKTPKIWQVRE